MRVALAILVLAVAAGGSPAFAAMESTAPACARGRFEIGAVRGPDGPSPIAVEMAGGMVSVVPDCPALAAEVRVTRRATRLRARWTGCPGLGDPVVLRARIGAPECTLMRGRLRVGSRRTRFTATCAGACAPAAPGKPPLTTGCTADLGPEACAAHQGDYERRGLAPEPSCHCRTQDGGASCARATDCQGMCFAESDGAEAGRCSAYVVEFGCFTVLDEQGARVALCVD